MATPTSPTATLPSRSTTDMDDVIPDEDSSEATKLFYERLQAWKHACGYLESYIGATEKLHEHQTKEYEKVLKTVNSPLREGHHFDQQTGGIAGLFESIRSNTQGLANSNTETAKTLKGTVLPTFERLHAEIKAKQKELNKSAGKGAKAVDKARAASQKHIEQLGQHSAHFDSAATLSLKATDDPYILQRQIYHRLHKQVQEENNNRDDMLAVQNNFATFEAHVIDIFQQGLQQFQQVLVHQSDQSRAMYTDILGTAQCIPKNFEWEGFLHRNSAVLIDPTAPKRTVESIRFANQDHRATQPLIAGSLERKKMLKRYDAGFYVVTPSKYLHEFKTDDDFAKDPTPENSLYLPDCLTGAVDGTKFVVKGKDTSKGAIGNKFAMSHEYAFKAHTAADAVKWHDIIASVSGQVTQDLPESTPTSRQASGAFPPAAAESSPVEAEKSAAAPAAVAEPTEGVVADDKAAVPASTAAPVAAEKPAA